MAPTGKRSAVRKSCLGRSRLRQQDGFSFAEILVGGLVLVIGLVAISQFFASAVARVVESDVRSVLHQVASQELEAIRGLPYTEVGTTDGHPVGALVPTEERQIGQLAVTIERKVTFWTDDTYSGPYGANYRRVNVKVTAVDRPAIDPVEVTTNVAGGAEGGTLDITVIDSAGTPIPNANITITNSTLTPDVNITALRTNSEGRLLVPGLDVDTTGGYVVSATKAGYSTDTDSNNVVNDGLPYTEVVLTIDPASTLVVHVVDTDGEDVGSLGLALTIDGPNEYSSSITSVAGGVTITGLGCSTEAEPYIVSLVEGQGYVATAVAAEPVAPGATISVTVTVDEFVVVQTYKLLVRAREKAGKFSYNPVRGAEVQIRDAATGEAIVDGIYTGNSGWAPEITLAAGTYTLTVIRTNYYTHTETLVLDGDENNHQVTLTRIGG